MNQIICVLTVIYICTMSTDWFLGVMSSFSYFRYYINCLERLVVLYNFVTTWVETINTILLLLLCWLVRLYFDLKMRQDMLTREHSNNKSAFPFLLPVFNYVIKTCDDQRSIWTVAVFGFLYLAQPSVPIMTPTCFKICWFWLMSENHTRKTNTKSIDIYKPLPRVEVLLLLSMN